MMRKDSRTAYCFSLTGRLSWIVLISLLLLASCRSGPPTAEDRAKTANGLVKAGKEDFTRGDIDSAISKFEEVLQLVPDWTTARRDYAELLYYKGLGYDRHSLGTWQRALGKEFDNVTHAWKESGAVVSEGEKAKLEKDSDEAKRQALLYYRQSLEQLQILDRMVRGADEGVVCAMAILHIFLNELDQAKACFERVLESPRVEEGVKERIRNALDAINKFQKQEATPGT